MFSVYGRSKPIAKKKVHKMMMDIFSDLSIDLKNNQGDTQQEKQSIVDSYIQKEFESMGLKRCTHEFSTHEFSKCAFDLMIKDADNFAELILMKKVNKSNGATSKVTGKPMMEWVEIIKI